MDDVIIERMLRTVECIPPGRVATYGEIGSLLGLSPRLVGRIMATWGSSTPWWRVTNAAGELPAHLLADADAHWQAEGITKKPTGRGCRIRAHRVDLNRLASDADAACADLPATTSGPRGHDTASGFRRDHTR